MTESERKDRIEMLDIMIGGREGEKQRLLLRIAHLDRQLDHFKEERDKLLYCYGGAPT